jgi:membrane protein DedA with SNARE-associated domain
MTSKVAWKLVGGVLAVIAVLAVGGVIYMALSDDVAGGLDEDTGALASYLLVFLMVYGDAVVAIFPGETTLNVAATLASQDVLDLPLVILAGFLGAWLGDNTLYWIARSIPTVREKARQAQEDERFKGALQLVGRHSALLVVFCRFLPFVRWAVTAGMGALPMPYRSYIAWSAVGAFAWASYTCLVAYFISSALDEFPVASIVIACVSSTILIGGIFLIERWRRRRSAVPEPLEGDISPAG